MLCLRNALKLLQPVAESLSFLAHVQLKTNHKPHRPSGCPDRNLPGLLPHWSWQSSLHPWLHENRHGFQRKWWKYSIVWRKLRNLSTGEEEELATQLTLDLLTHHSFYSSSLSSYIATLPVSLRGAGCGVEMLLSSEANVDAVRTPLRDRLGLMIAQVRTAVFGNLCVSTRISESLYVSQRFL